MLETANLAKSVISPNHPNLDYRSVRRVLGQVLTVNLLVALAKIVAGLSTGSISMMADGFHSVMDASSNVIGVQFC